MSTPPQDNPYAAMPAASVPVESRRVPRWFAVLVSLFAPPFAGAGLLVLRRTRLALPFLTAGIVLFLVHALAAPAVSMVALGALVLVWLAGVIVTASASAGEFAGWTRTLVVGVGLVVAAKLSGAASRAFLLADYSLPSGSMRPTLLEGDNIVVDRTVHRPGRGDVIVFKYPQDPSVDYVKRVIALPGEKVSILHDVVLVDGVPLARRRVDQPGGTVVEGQPCELWEERSGSHVYQVCHRPDDHDGSYDAFTVPPDGVFVLGDNRDGSNDSRVWGAVPLLLVKGRVTSVFFSNAPKTGLRWGRLGRKVE
jgi:signal peptidase I